MSFDLLSEPIRKYIRDKGWEQLRPIQTAAIAKIISSEENYILASRTASGKTEAAFLPILSKVFRLGSMPSPKRPIRTSFERGFKTLNRSLVTFL